MTAGWTASCSAWSGRISNERLLQCAPRANGCRRYQGHDDDRESSGKAHPTTPRSFSGCSSRTKRQLCSSASATTGGASWPSTSGSAARIRRRARARSALSGSRWRAASAQPRRSSSGRPGRCGVCARPTGASAGAGLLRSHHDPLPPHDVPHHRSGAEPGFYEALGFEFRRELPIVRDGELEATNYFFGIPGQEEELELTFNHDGRTYELGNGVRPHRAVGRRPRRDPCAAEGAGHRARARAVPRPRGRLPALLRPDPDELSNRADRPQRQLARFEGRSLLRAGSRLVPHGPSCRPSRRRP